LAEGRNLLGRFTLAVTTSMNDQHRLGLDLDGNAGENLFSTADFTTATSKIFTPSHVLAPSTNSSPYPLTLSLNDSTNLVASDYAVSFTSATGGSLARSADGSPIGFSYTAATGQFLFQTAADAASGPFTGATFDGLSFSAAPATAAVAGDRFLLQPFSNSASNIKGEFSSARALAVASPVAGKMGVSNTGSLQIAGLKALANPSSPALPTPVLLAFTGPNTYTLNGGPSQTYVSGQTITTTQWSLVLQGAPKNGDTLTVFGVKDGSTDALTGRPYNNGIDLKLNAGNASAMMGLRDVETFDGAKLSDGFAALIAQVGIRTQSAMYASDVSSAIAASLETERTAVSGVNLDEEAAKLLQYQQAYQASAKMIQIAQSIFDTLLQTMR
jgi:flagellar hook-associated protein 1 FlgK